jgi:hypothetical protein
MLPGGLDERLALARDGDDALEPVGVRLLDAVGLTSVPRGGMSHAWLPGSREFNTWMPGLLVELTRLLLLTYTLLPGRMTEPADAGVSLSFSGLEGGVTAPFSPAAFVRWISANKESQLDRSMRAFTGGFSSTSPQPDIDFRFLRLTFLFLATGVRFAAGFVGVGVDLHSVSMTSISTRILEVGSWSTVHCGTVTGCVWVCGELVTTWTRPVEVVTGRVWLGVATILLEL